MLSEDEDTNMLAIDNSDDEGTLLGDSSMREMTPVTVSRKRESRSQLNTRKKVALTLEFMRSKRLKLDDLLNCLFYGDPVLRSDQRAKSSRTQLTSSPLFPTILEHLLKPPRTKSKGKRAYRSAAVIAEVTEKSIVTELSAELDSFAKILHMDSDDNISLCSPDGNETIFKDISSQLALAAPRLTRILSEISASHDSAKTGCKVTRLYMRSISSISLNNLSSYLKIVETILCQLAFRKNQRNNRLQKVVCLYLKAKGTPTKVVNLLSQFGISMSYRWSTDATRFYSNEELAAFGRRTTARLSTFIVYDNVRIIFKKETQRVNNQTHGDNGTSITAVDIKDDGALQLLEDYGRAYQDMQLRLLALPVNDREQLSPADFFDLDAAKQINSFNIYLLIDVLLNSDSFANYEHRTNPLLSTPEPIHQLPIGKASRTFTMLATLPIEEASYEGNLLVLDQCSRLLSGGKGPTSTDQKKALSSHGIPFVGDQLTHSRLSGLKQMRRSDRNSFDRLGWLIPCFGWFHLLMLLGTSIIQIHRGTHSSYGFGRTITNLDIKGLPEKGKKYYYHTVDVLLDTDFKARVLNLWIWATGKNTIKDIFDSLNSVDGPEKMVEFATKILSERASTTALKILSEADQDDDEVLRDSIILNRDALLYHQLRAVIRKGDVGHLEKLIPDLSIVFKGANNNNYAKMLLDYMQWSRFELPPGVSDAVRNNCWLVNLSGRANNFYPTDQLQEHNNKLIKNVHAPMGNNATWDLINALTPAIPFLGRIVDVTEQSYGLVHSSKHTLPDNGLDLKGLRRLYRQSHITNYNQGRKRSSPKIKDIVTKGIHALHNTNWLSDFHGTRDVYMDHYNVDEIYSLGSSDDIPMEELEDDDDLLDDARRKEMRELGIENEDNFELFIQEYYFD